MLSRITGVFYFVFAVCQELWGAIWKRLKTWTGAAPR
jgi:hypothetical protein